MFLLIMFVLIIFLLIMFWLIMFLLIMLLLIMFLRIMLVLIRSVLLWGSSDNVSTRNFACNYEIGIISISYMVIAYEWTVQIYHVSMGFENICINLNSINVFRVIACTVWTISQACSTGSYLMYMFTTICWRVLRYFCDTNVDS